MNEEPITIVPVTVTSPESVVDGVIICPCTVVIAMIYPYAVYVPEAVNVIILLEPDVVTVGLPVVVPE
jgi:hypothetical protein